MAGPQMPIHQSQPIFQPTNVAQQQVPPWISNSPGPWNTNNQPNWGNNTTPNWTQQNHMLQHQQQVQQAGQQFQPPPQTAQPGNFFPQNNGPNCNSNGFFTNPNNGQPMTQPVNNQNWQFWNQNPTTSQTQARPTPHIQQTLSQSVPVQETISTSTHNVTLPPTTQTLNNTQPSATTVNKFFLYISKFFKKYVQDINI